MGGGSNHSSIPWSIPLSNIMIPHRGANVNVQLHQALSLNGARLGRGGPGSTKRTTNYMTMNQCPPICVAFPCKSPCDKYYIK
jgi:hypothetical protein